MDATMPATQTRPHTRPSGVPAGPDIRRLLRLKVPVIVKLADRQMRLGEVMRLSTGSIIEFNKSVEGPLELLVNNVPVGQGEVVKIGENFGLRVSRFSGPMDTIRALGGELPASDADPATVDPLPVDEQAVDEILDDAGEDASQPSA